MKKRLIILGIIVLLAASALTAVLLYNRFTASKTRSFEVSTGDQITYALKTGTGIDMASDTNGNIVFTVDGISEAVFASWCTLDDYSDNVERLTLAGIGLKNKTYGKNEALVFEYVGERSEYGAMVIIPDSSTAILFKSNTDNYIERILKNSNISVKIK